MRVYTKVMESVPVGRLRPHPENPRRGNVEMIAESLRVNGQYKPVVAHRATGHILAGTHTWRAAKKLGWKEIQVQYTECTEAQARQIMLADNRASDAGFTDESAAFQILSTLPTLDGTGYTPADLELPEVQIDGWQPDDGDGDSTERETPTQERRDPQEGTQPFHIGRARGTVSQGAYDRWRAELPRQAREAADIMLVRLGLLEELSPAAQPAAATITGGGFALLKDLVRYPGNPRQGDIGLLMGLLQQHGQYRQIVVNRRNNRILAGNHLADAARQLGWERIGVAYVDTDEDGEKRILLADNRTADLATYDMEALGRAVAQVGAGGLEGTGFSLTDLDDILAGRQPREAARSAGAWVQVGAVKAKVRAGLIAEAGFTDGQELLEGAAMLGFDPAEISSGRTEQNPIT